MAAELAVLDLRTRAQWRAWLTRHHASSPGVWLAFHKQHTGVASIAYEDSVREALCFGWVDSIIKSVDDGRFVRKFTPRNAGSKWSDTNRKRWAELKEAGLLSPTGIAAAPTDNAYAPRPEIPELPSYIAEAFQNDAAAWAAFLKLAPSHRCRYVTWIHMAKRPETREKRIRESIALLGRGEKLGLK